MKIKIKTVEDIIELGVLMGLKFDKDSNFKDALEDGRVVFDGINGQRFSAHLKWGSEDIIKSLSRSVLLMGYRQKAKEINNVLSINSDFIEI